MVALPKSRTVNLNTDETITITRRTVRFSKTVYQTHNIAEFSEGEIEINHPLLLTSVAVSVVIFIFLMISTNNFSQISSVIPMAGCTVLLGLLEWSILKLIKPKHYGLMITLNSGDKNLFITSDKKGLKRVISTIYDFIEFEEDATYQISISDSQVMGNFIQGDAGDVWFNSGD